MDELTLHPHIYSTGRSTGLLPLLERVWVREHTSGNGTLYIVSGFANYNGGIRFFPFSDSTSRTAGEWLLCLAVAPPKGSLVARLSERCWIVAPRFTLSIVSA